MSARSAELEGELKDNVTVATYMMREKYMREEKKEVIKKTSFFRIVI